MLFCVVPTRVVTFYNEALIMIIHCLKPTGLLLLLLSFNVVSAEAQANFFNENFHDYQENLEEANDQKKLGIFVFFYLDDCPFCHKMRQQVLNQKSVIAFYNKNFLNYEEDANGSIEVVNFKGKLTTQRLFSAEEHNVFATPVLAFFDLKGKMVSYRTGFLNAADFLLFGQFVKDKRYLETNFIRYKRKIKG